MNAKLPLLSIILLLFIIVSGITTLAQSSSVISRYPQKPYRIPPMIPGPLYNSQAKTLKTSHIQLTQNEKVSVSIHVKEVGTLRDEINKIMNYLKVEKLIVSGYLNGTDIFTVRIMANCSGIWGEDWLAHGALSELDLSEAHIVEGGDPYYLSHYQGGEMPSYTENNTIGYEMFGSSESLRSIILPNSVKKIETWAFGNSSILSSITLPSSLEELNSSAFAYCYNLEEISIFNCNSFVSIGGVIYNKEQTSLVAYPNALDSSYTVPLGVNRIVPYAFYGCRNLTSIKLPKTLIEIGDYSFAYCNLTEIIISKDVTQIGNSVFTGCRNFQAYNIEDGNSNFSSVNGILFSADKKRLIEYPGGKKDTIFTIPNETTTIGESAFKNCTNLCSVKMESSQITSIEEDAFSYCKNLSSIILPTSLKDMGAWAFNNCTNLSSILMESTSVTKIKNGTFINCENLSFVTLPASLKEIENEAFAYTNLSKVILHAIDPPLLNWFSFFNCSPIIQVPIASVEEYQKNSNWSQFSIESLAEERGRLEVTIPNTNGLYSGLTLELINTTNSSKSSLSTTSKSVYAFSGLVIDATYRLSLKDKNGNSLTDSREILIVEGENKIELSNLTPFYTANTLVQDPQGKALQSVTVKWYDSKDQFIAQGDSLKGLTLGTTVNCRVELDGMLGVLFVTPDIQQYTVREKDNTIIIILEPIKQVSITGIVKDKTGKAVSNAVVSISQLLNRKNPKNIITKSNKEGVYNAQIYNDSTTISITYPNCLQQNITRTNFNNGTDMGIMTLAPIEGATINLQLNYTHSVAPGETSIKEQGYFDYQNIMYVVENTTQKRVITNFSVQYPHLVLLDPTDAKAGDHLNVKAVSRTYKFETSESNVIIDSNLKATAQLDIVQMGMIRMNYIESDNLDKVAIVYNNNGKFVKRYNYVNQTLTTDELDNGTYQIVSMVTSNFFNSILNMKELTTAGLTEGKDYIVSEATVQSGRITLFQLQNIPKLNESKLYYTGTSTAFNVNKQSVVAGNYVTLRSAIDFKPEFSKRVSNVKLIVDLPDYCEFIQNSVMVGNRVVNGYTINENQLIVPLENYAEGIRFCVIPTQGGMFTPSAFVEFTLNGKKIYQPIGAAPFSSTDVVLNVPARTSRKNILVSGLTTANSMITVYDKDVAIGMVKSQANGSWSLSIDLYKPYSYSLHDIHIEITTPMGFILTSENKQVIHNTSGVEVSKVTMINIAHPASSLELCEYTTVFDYLNPTSQSPVYWYWPTYPEFTFQIEFTRNDTALVKNVILNVFTSSGNIVPLETMYEPHKKYWIAKGNFDSNNLPINVGVNFSSIDSIDTNSYKIYLADVMSDGIPNIISEMPDIYLFDIENIKTSSILKYSNFRLPQSTWQSIKQMILNNNYKLVVSEKKQELYMTTFSYIHIESFKDSIYIHSCTENSEYDFIKSLINIYFPSIIIKHLKSSIPVSNNKLENARDKMIQGLINEANRKLKCADEKTEIQLQEAIRCLRRNLSFTFGSFAAHTFSLFGSATGEGSPDVRNFGEGMDGLSKNSQHQINVIKNAPECDNPIPDPSPNSNAKALMDPSGFVYEAVASNRLQGVTTTVYYKTEEEDIYGDKHEKIVLWEAENYGQENPLLTDKNGMYAWDVPQGMWQVKYEKDGYQTTFSEWLPVPPPQLEVNIGMIQASQPEIHMLKGYEGGIDVTFNKFMIPSTITSDRITITRNGVTESGSISLQNSETDPYSGKTFVSQVRFMPSVPFITTDLVVITISGKVKSYAEVLMGADFTASVPIEKEPKGIVVEPEVEVAYNQSTQLTISVEPTDAAIGKKIFIHSASPSIVTVTNEAILNNNGEAVLTIHGELPGTSILTLIVEDMTLKAEVTVHVAMPIEYLTVDFDSQGGSPVTTTTVEKGTLVTKPANPQRENYDFKGWFKESICINAWDFDNDKVTSNLTLYAKWDFINHIDKIDSDTRIFGAKETIIIEGAENGATFTIYDIKGTTLTHGIITQNHTTVNIGTGVYIVRTSKKRVKVVVR